MAAVERYSSDTTDLGPNSRSCLAKIPDALLIAAQSEFNGGTIIKQVRELGYEGQIYADIVPVGATALEIAGDACRGYQGHLGRHFT